MITSTSSTSSLRRIVNCNHLLRVQLGINLPSCENARHVHSNTQIKRLFKKNPARARIEGRMGIDRTPPPLEPPKYPIVYKDFNLLPNGWSNPPGPETELPQYPFGLKRTKNKPHDAVGFLPIYTKFR
jgi:hypothetical protein